MEQAEEVLANERKDRVDPKLAIEITEIELESRTIE
jgi:hypothetical protein